jgi:hypothetical protein
METCSNISMHLFKNFTKFAMYEKICTSLKITVDFSENPTYVEDI